MKRYLFAALCCMPLALIAQRANVLKKAYFHQGAHQDAQAKGRPQIELGTIALYFDHTPRIESSIVQKKGETLQLLFLPNVAVTPELMQALAVIRSQAENQPFSVKFAVKNDASRKGLEIALTYPTDAVGVKYDHFNSIGLQKGIALRFYNKSLISKINQIGKHIITTAALAPRVFIDCGHGGADCGAIGNAVKEKDVSLNVGLSIADLLKEQGLSVALSRITDEFVPLDARTTLANHSNADLFVSIHANSAPNTAANGIETFFFDADLLKEGECFFSTLCERKQAKDQQQIKQMKSNQLAHHVHSALISTVQGAHSVIDRTIKPAISQVLLGTQMPSVLVEVGFVTNLQEAVLLSQKAYQEKIAHGIAAGIMHYLGRA